MRTKTIKLYTFDELSDEAKEKAIDQYRENQREDIPCFSDEMLDSLKGLFEHCSGVELKDYSLGEYNSWIKVSFSEDVDEMSGKRAFAWLENNLLTYIRIPETSLKVKNSRKECLKYGKGYRAGEIKSCPFTGVCYDEDFLQGLISDIKDGSDLKTAFEGLATTYQKMFSDELEYMQSEEYIKETFDTNGYEFLENGEMA